jgi:hypothetical protein
MRLQTTEASMEDGDVARNVLTKVFPEECQAIGPASVEDAVSGDVRIVPPEEGRPFPVMEIFEFLREGAQFILSVYAIYKIIWNESGGRKPMLQELKHAVAKKKPKSGALTPEQIEKILKEIAKL